ncbi:DUF3825 domain-containing protein [Bifidobacterium scardovii]|uniref:DUF3825 domain-containing protein n=1 Tax=Bifidobacterium scardovii TaxID=158787 RepID=UPI000AF962D9|nr:DUF3825 domain-containing protein [Bifidobacterium scardovii]MBS6947937.1 DUF3825 domain-containing protein [Bifidobacterium scardovii]MDU3735830.1 DUF3825 domain-containing protein [Bifidobacterium scardovii]MDU5296309.1 DUF3825 domain-containing protein [Bifidobacterium scardovii]MDU5611033.1 DUF3825 domain-containing protein [Bifidobacterium scardovii]MDU5886825.1 DUF3825 domain-containing protein [Bifidobacterium scardovii]
MEHPSLPATLNVAIISTPDMANYFADPLRDPIALWNRTRTPSIPMLRVIAPSEDVTGADIVLAMFGMRADREGEPFTQSAAAHALDKASAAGVVCGAFFYYESSSNAKTAAHSGLTTEQELEDQLAYKQQLRDAGIPIGTFGLSTGASTWRKALSELVLRIKPKQQPDRVVRNTTPTGRATQDTTGTTAHATQQAGGQTAAPKPVSTPKSTSTAPTQKPVSASVPPKPKQPVASKPTQTPAPAPKPTPATPAPKSKPAPVPPKPKPTPKPAPRKPDDPPTRDRLVEILRKAQVDLTGPIPLDTVMDALSRNGVRPPTTLPARLAWLDVMAARPDSGIIVRDDAGQSSILIYDADATGTDRYRGKPDLTTDATPAQAPAPAPTPKPASTPAPTQAPASTPVSAPAPALAPATKTKPVSAPAPTPAPAPDPSTLVRLPWNPALYRGKGSLIEQWDDKQLKQLHLSPLPDDQYDKVPGQDALLSEVRLTPAVVAELQRCLVPATPAPSMLASAWSGACASRALYLDKEQRVAFPIDSPDMRDSRYRIGFIKRTADGTSPSWELAAVNDGDMYPTPVRQLDHFARIGLYDNKTHRSGKKVEALSRLAEYALPEHWQLDRKDNKKVYNILDGYLSSTLCRAKRENKLLISRDGDRWLAAFNTGLYTRVGKQPIIACFERNKDKHGDYRPQWKLVDFATQSGSMSGMYSRSVKKVLDRFNMLPEEVTYDVPTFDYQSLTDPNRSILNGQHIFQERLFRFPVEFLWDVTRDEPSIQESWPKLPHGVDECEKFSHEAQTLIGRSPDLQDRLRARFEERQIRAARDAAAGRTVVPAYRQQDDAINFMLPISLGLRGDNPRNRRVLVVNQQTDDDGKVSTNITTIFTLSYAYEAARIVGPVSAPWLTQIFRSPADDPAAASAPAQ